MKAMRILASKESSIKSDNSFVTEKLFYFPTKTRKPPFIEFDFSDSVGLEIAELIKSVLKSAKLKPPHVFSRLYQCVVELRTAIIGHGLRFQKERMSAGSSLSVPQHVFHQGLQLVDRIDIGVWYAGPKHGGQWLSVKLCSEKMEPVDIDGARCSTKIPNIGNDRIQAWKVVFDPFFFSTKKVHAKLASDIHYCNDNCKYRDTASNDAPTERYPSAGVNLINRDYQWNGCDEKYSQDHCQGDQGNWAKAPIVGLTHFCSLPCYSSFVERLAA